MGRIRHKITELHLISVQTLVDSVNIFRITPTREHGNEINTHFLAAFALKSARSSAYLFALKLFN
ncbi:hypothetical protein BZG75_14445 [Salinivibrio sp. AR640]|nr:hypothetical protein BZG75_14445 [Salinivibrio sp. AR640]